MHVDVDNGDTLEAARERRGGRHGDVVEQAEAHRAIALGVMARRPHERERRLSVVQRVLHRLDSRTRCEQRDVVRIGRGERVRIQHPTGKPGRGRDAVDVRSVVHSRQFFARRGPRRGHPPARFEPLRGDRVEHVGPFRPLGMPRRRDVRVEAGGRNQQHGSAE